MAPRYNELRMQSSLVSTIIPVFNRAGMLREAVASVSEQTYRPIEILIIDDGSTDDTGGIADALADSSEGLVQVLHQANAGVGLAREAGRQAVRGEFIQYLDSDDLLLPRKFEVEVAALRASPQCGIAYGPARHRDAVGREIVCDWKPANRIERTLFPSLLLARWWDTPVPLFRRSVTDAIGPWTSLSQEEDWEYDARAGALGVLLAHVEETGAEIRDHDLNRLSRGGATNPARLGDRARAHELILSHARRAGVSDSSPEMLAFARGLFLLARQCGAAGLDDESSRLIRAARSVSPAVDLRVYEGVARLLGWTATGKLALLSDRLRW